MELSSSEAAKAVGISKQSIIRAIHKGKVSAQRNGNGEFVIDTSELFRAYQPATPTVTNGAAHDDTVTPDQTEVLQAKVTLLERIIGDKDTMIAMQAEAIADLRRRLDASTAQVDQMAAVMAQLTPPKAKVGWWQRLLGGGA